MSILNWFRSIHADEYPLESRKWDLFECAGSDHPPIELQRIDAYTVEEGGFESDPDAWEHVVRSAQRGDITCAAALHLLAVESPDEHHAIMDHRRNLIHKMRCLLGGKPYCPEEDH